MRSQRKYQNRPIMSTENAMPITAMLSLIWTRKFWQYEKSYDPIVKLSDESLMLTVALPQQQQQQQKWPHPKKYHYHSKEKMQSCFS